MSDRLGVLSTAVAATVALATFSAQADVIRVDLQPNAPFAGRAPVNFTGVESSAAAANPIFGANGSNTWNYLSIPPAGSGSTVNPSFSNLVDSTGVPTSVGITFTGSVRAANDTPIDTNDSNGLENDYFFIFTNTVDYTISGLPASTLIAFYIYSPNFTHSDSGDPTDQPNRGFQPSANGNTIDVPSGFGTNNALADIMTDASGDISGIWSTPDGNEGDWSGFQLGFPLSASVPEPSSLILLASSLLGLGLARRRKTAR
jgi:PEP-CTERM motif